jgi:hypothetical protein
MWLTAQWGVGGSAAKRENFIFLINKTRLTAQMSQRIGPPPPQVRFLYFSLQHEIDSTKEQEDRHREVRFLFFPLQFEISTVQRSRRIGPHKWVFFLFLPIKMSLKDSTDEWEDRPHMWFFSLSTGILYYAVFENLLDWLQHVYSNVADWIPVIDLACYRYRYYRVQQLFFKPGHVLFHVSVYAIQIILAQNCLQ